MLKITRRKKKTASERRSCGYTKLCENYATGSKSSDIGEEVRFKTLPLLNTLPRPKEISPNSEYCCGKEEKTVSKKDAVNAPISVKIVQEELKAVTLEKR